MTRRSSAPPNGLTADEWNDMRRAADGLDTLLGDLFHGRKKLDADAFVKALGYTETIQSTINVVLGPPGEDE